MIKIAHEAPIDLFDEVQRLTDYDYALVHLLEENSRYRDTFENAVKKGREVILDDYEYVRAVWHQYDCTSVEVL